MRYSIISENKNVSFHTFMLLSLSSKRHGPDWKSSFSSQKLWRLHYFLLRYISKFHFILSITFKYQIIPQVLKHLLKRRPMFQAKSKSRKAFQEAKNLQKLANLLSIVWNISQNVICTCREHVQTTFWSIFQNLC